ncbi:hypothetical protein PGT21_008755 [Puccinia graminis f. sp. tritici]|uniref:Rpr2-domain-containing protein n=1 Tax=Puccinia graminis f. sp. tritici TaxID=56615 RepID=A0A5B0LK07_PUCGR|nr:hypothetical protein PGT21_008755 [Puccinia graminis f. sp. tritici]
MTQKSKRGPAQGPNPKAVQNGEVLQRLNFLHQAANYLATVTSTTANPSEPDRVQVSQNDVKQNDSNEEYQRDLRSQSKRRKKQNKRKPQPCRPIANLPMLGLSRTLSKTMKVISKKAVLRMDPSVKRSICRSCHLLLIPGYTSSTRVLRSSSHRHKVNVTCSACQHQRQIPHPPESNITPEHTDTPDQSREKSKKQRERAIPFWRQPQHVTFAAQAVVEGSM